MTSAYSFCFGQLNNVPFSSTCQIIIDGTNLTLIGKEENVMTTRAEIMNSYPIKKQLLLKIPDQDCNELRIECDKIASCTNTTISVDKPISQSPFHSQNNIHILITGIPDSIEQAQIQILVMLDKQSNLVADTLHIPYKLHVILCERKRTGLQPILKETAASIYFPSPFIFEAEDDYSPPIYITGESNDVLRVKEMLSTLSSQKTQSMYQKEAILHPRKLDWLLLHRREDLKKIMRDNGAFIAFPKMGSNNDRVTVHAENRVNVERTLRSLHTLACGIYEACFYFNQRDSSIYGSDTPSFFNSTANVSSLISQLSQISGAEVTYKAMTGCIEVYGTERAIRQVYQRLQEMAFIKIFPENTVFNVELSNDQKEFISGKKSGKINKIMKTSGAKIKFITFNEYNFIIEVESNNFSKALDGLKLLQEELPAEISFYVPEIYHKRIIGVGGKNIQRIMKKYGVYVKFSNAEEFAALGGYYDNEDNVVARTPMKNQVNLDKLRHAVMDLINPKDRDCVEQYIDDVPFWIHRTFIRDQAVYLTETTKNTNTRLIWPDHEEAVSRLTLVGPEAQVAIAAQAIKAVVPEQYNLYLLQSPLLRSVLESEQFEKNIINRLSNEYKIRVQFSTKDTMSDEQILSLITTQGNIARLTPALEIIFDFLKSHHVNLDRNSSTKRTMTGEDINHTNFPLYDKKLISSVLPSDLTSPTSSSSLLSDFSSTPPQLPINSNNPLKKYTLFDYPSSNSGNALDALWKNFRDMNTPRATDNIRAIFDSSEVNKPPAAIPLMPPLGFRGANPTNTTGMDIWSNTPSHSMNGFMGSPPLTGLDSNYQPMVYQPNHNHNNGFYQPFGTKADYHNYVVPTSSTSTGSNNSSMHSSQSLPDILLEEREHRHTSPSPSTLPFQNCINTQPPPLIYPSYSTTSSSNKALTGAQFSSLTSSSSTPVPSSLMNSMHRHNTNHHGGSDNPMDFPPVLFSQNHSSVDEAIIVQNLLNNMSLGQSKHNMTL
ncbi:hypothetical protein BDB01DRAFT_781420 [Pilobolus umbonatus]|nr:hypothetical protein BDB01DRAFT_781420 [Pilobolus umbonatus]